MSIRHDSAAIAAYPLQWPAGWRRTDVGFQERARFGKAARHEGYGDAKRWIPSRELTISEGIQRALAELTKMGLGRDDVVISTNLRLRLDGLPRSDQREPNDPGVAVYWEDQAGGRKVMAIDLYDRVADNLAAVAATLEAMRSIERHGGAAILERAFTGFVALPPPASKHWRDVLDMRGIYTATTTDVEHAFRRLASKHHPDKGGSVQKMVELNAAREEALREVSNG